MTHVVQVWKTLLLAISTTTRYRPLSHIPPVLSVWNISVWRVPLLPWKYMYLSSSEIERVVPLTESVQIFPCDFAGEREERLGTL